MDNISLALRERILSAGEQDIRVAMQVENDGGPIVEKNANDLQDVRHTSNLLFRKLAESLTNPTQLGT